MTAPKETPVVNPVFNNPMNKPLLFLPESSRTRMKEIVMIPEPPIPVITLPSRKVLRSSAWEVTIPPMAKRIDAARTQFRGENI
jgi:hypothetical protein